MCSGSTIANITALWAAREVRGVKKVVASRSAHFSIDKAASLLGLSYEQIPTDVRGRLNLNEIEDTSDACLVLTAGTTDTGAIDPLALVGKAKWTHVDAAWAGPLRLSLTHAYLLDGITGADSIAVSAHKWLFQPKDSSLIMFRDTELANSGISFGGSYLAAPNVGLQGSRGAAAVPLLATMVSLGRKGIAGLVDHSMALATRLATEMTKERYIRLWAMPETGVTLFQPTEFDTQEFYERLPKGMFSTCVIDEELWVRSVAANPLADIDKIIEINQSPIGRTPRSNPVTYTGTFTPIRDWFASLPESKTRGYKAGRFSFNVKGGRCEHCEGDGLIKVEMHFLSDVYVTCDVCHGKRYNRETLEVMYKGKNISDVLDMTVYEAVEFFKAIPAIRDKLIMLLSLIHI